MRSIPYAALLLATTAIALACDSGPTQPAGAPDHPEFAVVTNEVTHEVSGFATNDCTGEVLAATARDHELG